MHDDQYKMSERFVSSKCARRYSLSNVRTIYGALDLIANSRTGIAPKTKHSRSSHYRHNKTCVKKSCDTKRLRTPGNMTDTALQRIPPEELLSEREKTRLSQLLTVYGEQHSSSYRKGFNTNNFVRPPHFPNLVKPVPVTIGSLLRSSPQVSEHERENSGSKTQAFTLPDINQAKNCKWFSDVILTANSHAFSFWL